MSKNYKKNILKLKKKMDLGSIILILVTFIETFILGVLIIVGLCGYCINHSSCSSTQSSSCSSEECENCSDGSYCEKCKQLRMEELSDHNDSEDTPSQDNENNDSKDYNEDYNEDDNDEDYNDEDYNDEDNNDSKDYNEDDNNEDDNDSKDYNEDDDDSQDEENTYRNKKVRQILRQIKQRKRNRVEIAGAQQELSSRTVIEQTAEHLFETSQQVKNKILAMQTTDQGRKLTEMLFANLNSALSQALDEIEIESKQKQE